MISKARVKQLEKLFSATEGGKAKLHVLDYLGSADNKGFTCKGILYKDLKDYCRQNKTSNLDLFIQIKNYQNATH